ncbi:hypothetical protein CRUP_008516 [Coryphaenoides rupestris]|nr:hypothetical protein CRUP_008516 [Coryphaenoides rupestris]
MTPGGPGTAGRARGNPCPPLRLLPHDWEDVATAELMDARSSLVITTKLYWEGSKCTAETERGLNRKHIIEAIGHGERIPHGDPVPRHTANGDHETTPTPGTTSQSEKSRNTITNDF